MYASEPDCIVNAIVVLSIAAACALIEGRSAISNGLNSQIFPKKNLSPKFEAYGAKVENIAATSGKSFFLNGECFSTSVMKAESLAIGVFFDGALA